MTTETPTGFVLLKVRADVRNLAKSRAAAQGKSMQAWIEEAIRIHAEQERS